MANPTQCDGPIRPIAAAHGIPEHWFEHVESEPEYVTLMDPLDRILYVSQPAPNGEVATGESVYRFVDVEYQGVLREAIARVRDTGMPQHFDTRASDLHDDSTVYSNWLVALRGSAVEGILAFISTDVTKQNRIAAELELSDLTLRSLIDNSPDAIVIIDRDRRIVFVNRLLSGLEMADVLGAPAESFVPERDRQTVIDAVARVLATGEPVSYTSGFEPGGGGSRFSTRVVPIPGSTGIDRLMLVATDITAQVEAELEQERLAAAFRQAQKMDALGQLTGGVAHDFNNILVAICGNLEMAQMSDDDPVARASHISDALGAAEHAKLLTERLLAFSRKQTLRPRPVDVGELVAGMRELLVRSLGETICVRVDAAEHLPACKVDPAQLESAVLNLAVNARDAMPGGGDLGIQIRSVTVTDGDDGAILPGQYVLLEVADGGSGMTPQVLAQVFEPFFTTKEIGQGTGLGLSMVYGFVLQSGGQIRVISTPGVGTTVQIYLQPTAERPTPPPAHRPPQDAVRGHGEQVLVVEDNEMVRSLTVRVLEHLGYRTVEAQHADDALSRLAAEPDIDVMVTDVVLPGIVDGFTLAEQARVLRPSLPILYVSGYPQDVLASRNVTVDTDALLMKPYTTEQLADAVNRRLVRTASAKGRQPA